MVDYFGVWTWIVLRKFDFQLKLCLHHKVLSVVVMKS